MYFFYKHCSIKNTTYIFKCFCWRCLWTVCPLLNLYPWLTVSCRQDKSTLYGSEDGAELKSPARISKSSWLWLWLLLIKRSSEFFVNTFPFFHKKIFSSFNYSSMLVQHSCAWLLREAAKNVFFSGPATKSG